MKVFWSWQSDHPGKISRHFVREALEEAIVALQQDPDIQEAARDAELDHDRKGVPGSPDLANVILNKIGQSDAFVADVTPVGNVLGNTNKRLINSNVAIELGYALSALSDRALLMILNEAYGTRDDLKHKAGPIIYRLESSASKSKISNEKLSLAGKLKTALREMLKFTKKNEPAFIEVQFCDANPGRFFQKEEVLAVINDIEYSCISDGLVYIRIIPISIMPELSRVEAMQAAISGKLGVLDDRASGWSTAQNKYGVLVFESDSDTRKIISATQLFKSREIWGFDASMLSSERARRGIPTGWHEVMIAK